MKKAMRGRKGGLDPSGMVNMDLLQTVAPSPKDNAKGHGKILSGAISMVLGDDKQKTKHHQDKTDSATAIGANFMHPNAPSIFPEHPEVGGTNVIMDFGNMNKVSGGKKMSFGDPSSMVKMDSLKTFLPNQKEDENTSNKASGQITSIIRADKTDEDHPDKTDSSTTIQSHAMFHKEPSIFAEHQEDEVPPEELHPGHLEYLENASGKENKHKRKFIDTANKIIMMQNISRPLLSKENKEILEASKALNKKLEVKCEKKLTLLELAKKQQKLNGNKSSKLKARDRKSGNEVFNILEEDPFLTAYYKEEELRLNSELKQDEKTKHEPPKLVMEMTFNYPWKKLESDTTEQSKKMKEKKSDAKKTVLTNRRRSSQISHSTYDNDSLNVIGFSIFDKDDSIFKNKDRGSEEELLIRVTKAFHLKNGIDEEKEESKHCYLKCYLHTETHSSSRRKEKHSSTHSIVSLDGETSWNHMFILRGFSIEELNRIYVVIKVKENELDHHHSNGKGNHHNIMGNIRRKHRSLGKLILAGKDAKIHISGGSEVREPNDDELGAWNEACSNPGSSQIFQRYLMVDTDDKSAESEAKIHEKPAAPDNVETKEKLKSHQHKDQHHHHHHLFHRK